MTIHYVGLLSEVGGRARMVGIDGWIDWWLIMLMRRVGRMVITSTRACGGIVAATHS